MNEYIIKEHLLFALDKCVGVDEKSKSIFRALVNCLPPEDVGPTNQWISVKDRLPEETEEVLIFDGNEGIKVAYMCCGVFEDEGRYDYNDVTHWQPLLEPPKESEGKK